MKFSRLFPFVIFLLFLVNVNVRLFVQFLPLFSLTKIVLWYLSLQEVNSFGFVRLPVRCFIVNPFATGVATTVAPEIVPRGPNQTTTTTTTTAAPAPDPVDPVDPGKMI